MVRDRRYGRVLYLLLAVAALIGTLVFVGHIFAQGEGEAGAPPVPEGDMMGAPGAAPAGGGALSWSETPMEKELLITYDQFLAQSGQQRALIPDVYLFDAEGKPAQYTFNQWAQLHRIYASRREVVAEAAVAAVGRPGNYLATEVANAMAVKQNEIDTVRRVYEQGLNNFFFEVAFPQLDLSAVAPGATTVTINVGVYMGIKPGVAQRYPTLVYRALKKFDNYGPDRDIFRIVDYEGGMWNPKQIRLWRGAIAEWERLWSSNQIVLTLYDVEGDRIVSGRQSAQHNGGICAKLVHPDELNYTPMFETIIPPKDYTFEGGKLNLNYKKGWYYNFSFSLPVAQLAGLDRAEVQLIGADGLRGSTGQTQAPPRTETAARALPGAAAQSNEGEQSRAAVQAGVDQAKQTMRTFTPMMGQQIPPGFY